MATLAVAPAIRGTTGTDLGGVACSAGGDAFLNTGKEVAVVKNGSGASITVNFTTQVQIDGRAVPVCAVVIVAGATVAIGPFATGTYNDGTVLVQMTYSGVTSLTAKILQVTQA